jgi:hypothetical protein
MQYIIWGLVTLMSAFTGSYLGSYLKKKGENRAIHEDIGNLVEQVRAVTAATKEIEAKISSDVWDRQKRWELKRDVLFEAVRRLAIFEDALMHLDSTYQAEKVKRKPDEGEWFHEKAEATTRWSDASTRFEETSLLLGIVCGKETNDASASLKLFALQIAAKTMHGDLEAYRTSREELCRKSFVLETTIRKELEIDGAG